MKDEKTLVTTAAALPFEANETSASTSVEVVELRPFDEKATKRLLQKLDRHLIPYLSLIYLCVGNTHASFSLSPGTPFPPRSRKQPARLMYFPLLPFGGERTKITDSASSTAPTSATLVSIISNKISSFTVSNTMTVLPSFSPSTSPPRYRRTL